jgi:uncharacterized protein (DUF2235 family)
VVGIRAVKSALPKGADDDNVGTESRKDGQLVDAQEPQPRKLIVCCDGTWNSRDAPGAATTNVAKMARSLRAFDDIGVSQLIYYHPGVGTGNGVDQFFGGAFGVGLSGNVQSQYAFLADNFNYGDQIFLFGFSRGAYTVRSLAGLIGLVGLMQKADMDYFPQVYKIYMSREYREALVRGQDLAAAKDALRKLFPEGEANGQNAELLQAVDNSRRTALHFIGVWDTVGSLGVPYGPLSRIAASRYNFHDTDLSEAVNYAYQALAIDERRGAFPPTLWTRKAGRGALPEDQAHKQVLEQVWFAGSHSDIGGGYEDRSLSDISFLWMVSKAAAAATDDGGRPLAFDEDYLRKKVNRSMGALADSAGGMWRYLPKYVRALMAKPPEGKETCEFVHSSVVRRYKWPKAGSFEPFPYRPKNASALLDNPQPTIIAELSAFEKTYLPQDLF